MKKIMLVCAAMIALSAMTACKSGTATDNNRDWVDLGLPSGLLWASCNLGASSPEEYGDYYAWGEVETKSTYDWSTYKYANGGYNQLTKYCNDPEYGHNGFTDNLTTLQPSDDAATQKLGSGARMPTADEWRELIDNTTAEWTTLNGVQGLNLTADNGASLFLPAAGKLLGDVLYGAGTVGWYWSSTLSEYHPLGAWYFGFNIDDQVRGLSPRADGLTVRAVRANNVN